MKIYTVTWSMDNKYASGVFAGGGYNTGNVFLKTKRFSKENDAITFKEELISASGIIEINLQVNLTEEEIQ